MNSSDPRTVTAVVKRERAQRPAPRRHRRRPVSLGLAVAGGTRVDPARRRTHSTVQRVQHVGQVRLGVVRGARDLGSRSGSSSPARSSSGTQLVGAQLVVGGPAASSRSRHRRPAPGRPAPPRAAPDARPPGAGMREPEALGAADWQALGTQVWLLVTDPGQLAEARRLLEADLDAVDRACSRFRPDSELMRLGAAAGPAGPPGAGPAVRQPAPARARPR